MKISSIQNAGFYAKFINVKQNTTMSQPISVSGVDTVSFKATETTAPAFVKDVRNLSGMPCACCGIKMIANDKYDAFVNKLYYPADYALEQIKGKLDIKSANTNEVFSFLKEKAQNFPKKNFLDLTNINEVRQVIDKMPKEKKEELDKIQKLAKYVAHDSLYVFNEARTLHPHLHENEEKVFTILESYSNMYPNQTIEEILNNPKIKKKHLDNLHFKEENVLHEIKELAAPISPNSRKIINELIDNAKNVFFVEGEGETQKRGRAVKAFFQAESKIPERKQMKRILKALDGLPTSQYDVDAFMTKYAARSSNETIEVILGRSRSTFEHIKPHHRTNDNGNRSKANGICLCAKCNGKRKMTPYDIFIEENPQMIQNTQRQIDKIIKAINSGFLIGYDDYPKNVKRSLSTESNKKLKIITDNLDLKTAKKNRLARELETRRNYQQVN